MRFLVTGATGQIGHALVRRLAARGDAVRVLVRRNDVSFPPQVEMRTAQVFDERAFAAALDGVDHVVSALGMPEQYTADPSVFERVNVGLFDRLLRALPAAPVAALTYVSTYEVFRPVEGRIREDHPLADPAELGPYFASMRRALDLARSRAAEIGVELTTIHPAAVYGGRNTADGFTNYLDNVVHRRFWRVPFVFQGRFPLVHADSLAGAIESSIGHPRAFLVSDAMTTLRELAELADADGGAYVPPVLPVGLARAGASVSESIARLTATRPLMAKVQIDFVTSGIEPVADRAREVLGWRPLPLADGIARWRRQTREPR